MKQVFLISYKQHKYQKEKEKHNLTAWPLQNHVFKIQKAILYALWKNTELWGTRNNILSNWSEAFNISKTWRVNTSYFTLLLPLKSSWSKSKCRHSAPTVKSDLRSAGLLAVSIVLLGSSWCWLFNFESAPTVR